MVTATDIDAALDLLTQDARKLFDEGLERTEAIAASLRQHDVILSREVLLSLAFHGLGVLFDANTKSTNVQAGSTFRKVTAPVEKARADGRRDGGGAVLPPSRGFSEPLSEVMENAVMRYAKAKVVFGRPLLETDTAFMQNAASQAGRQQYGWAITGQALAACAVIYQRNLRRGEKFTDLEGEQQEAVVKLLSDADSARKDATAEA